jgi:formylglycine-generating enzyme required for sulfatase activity
MVCYSNEEPEHNVTVSDFRLDKYEVTVGRYRRFVAAYDGSPPAAGSGAHPRIPDSGWDSAWDDNHPTDRAGLISKVECTPGHQTWTDAAGANEEYPVNCVGWYEAFAFCVWDGGRLPTEAEWEYAAAGGSEDRLFPWGSSAAEPLPANYAGNHGTSFLAVGSEPAGRGRWDHLDLGGSMYEWTLDWYKLTRYTDVHDGCADCANLVPNETRVLRGGCYRSYGGKLRAADRDSARPTEREHYYFQFGIRCARNPA